MDTADKLPRSALTFLADLGKNNDKKWYDKNRDRCAEELVEPCRALVRGIQAELARPFPRITGSDKKSGGSLTR
ncbi:MAG: DUF2461 family protein, partial [Planctomycetota bacterium]